MPCDIIRLVKWVGNLTVVDVEVLCFLSFVYYFSLFLCPFGFEDHIDMILLFHFFVL